MGNTMSEMFLQQQPGVSAALSLAAFTMICATVIHFLIAHMGDSVHLNSLAVVSSRQLGKGRLNKGSATAGVVMRARATNVLRGEVEVMPSFDMRWLFLPLVALAWLLPVAGVSLTCLAFIVQLQDWSLEWCMGEFTAIAALCCSAFGYLCAHQADAQPRSESTELQQQFSAESRSTSPIPGRIRKWAAHWWSEGILPAPARWLGHLSPKGIQPVWGSEATRKNGHTNYRDPNSLSCPLRNV